MAKQASSFIESNLANFGTEFERNVKLHSAQSEKEWRKVDRSLNTSQQLCWRVEKFRLVQQKLATPMELHTGDSYVLFDKKPPADDSVSPQYTIYFWLGRDTTLDEMGTAAYKTVELDTFLGGLPVQRREVQSEESDAFNSAFGPFVYLPGGVETGFHVVGPNSAHTLNYQNWVPNMYSVHNRFVKKLVEFETPDPTDAYVLDIGKQVYIYEGDRASNAEKLYVTMFAQNIKKYRPEVEIIRDNSKFI